MNQQDRDLLVRLDTKLDGVGKDIGEIKGILTSYDGRIREVETDQATSKTYVDTLKAEVEKLRNKGNLQDLLISVGVVISFILGLTN